MDNPTTDPKPTFSILAAAKKYFGFIVVFLIISVTSGVLLADHEAKSPASWDTFTSKEAGVSFKHPKSYKVVEDKGWRITVYTNPANTEDNIKIVYLPSDGNNSIESQFLATCQPARVSTVDANGTQIKIYEDILCGQQKIDTSVMVNAGNGMNYDITMFGKTDKTRLYPFFSTFSFTTPTVQSLPTQTSVPPLSSIPSRVPSVRPKEETGVLCTMDAKQCPDGSWVGRSGPKCEFVCP